MEMSSWLCCSRGVEERARTGWVDGGGVMLEEAGGGETKLDFSSWGLSSVVDGSSFMHAGGGVEGI